MLLLAFFLGILAGLSLAAMIHSRRDARFYSCWSCTRARHCSQLPAEEE